MEEKEELGFLFDASALYPLFSRLGGRVYDFIDLISILDLTKYEVCNAVGVEVKHGLISDWRSVVEGWAKIFSRLKVYIVDDVIGVEELAVKLDVTFYDASYIFAAGRFGFVLVSEDVEMREKASTIGVKVFSLDDFIDRIMGG